MEAWNIHLLRCLSAYGSLEYPPTNVYLPTDLPVCLLGRARIKFYPECYFSIKDSTIKSHIVI